MNGRSSEFSVESTLKRPIHPLHIISDFNDHISPTQCNQVAQIVFERNNIPYEAPHLVSDVEQFNVYQGAYALYQLVKNLQQYGISKGVFVCVVDPEVGTSRQGLVVTTEEGYILVGPDRPEGYDVGLFGPVLSTLTIKKAYRIKRDATEEPSDTFQGRGTFTYVGARIASGEDPSKLKSYRDSSKPILEEIDLRSLDRNGFKPGQVVEIDGYNVKLWQKGIPTNERGEKAKSVTIKTPRLFRRDKLRWSHSVTAPVVNTFADVAPGKWLIYEGSSGRTREDNTGLVEIAINKQKAKDRLGVRIGEVLELSWKF